MSTVTTRESTAARQSFQSHELDVKRDVIEYAKGYIREKPEVAALWCFGVGFILGWKLKPW